MSFRAGAHHRTKLNKWVQDLKVRQIHRHPKYDDPVMFANDVALLLLDRPAQINSAIRPICLPGKNDRPRTDCTVTGWGRLDDFGRRPDYLMQVNTPFKDEHVLLLIRIKSSKLKQIFECSTSSLFRQAESKQLFILSIITTMSKSSLDRLSRANF